MDFKKMPIEELVARLREARLIQEKFPEAKEGIYNEYIQSLKLEFAKRVKESENRVLSSLQS